MIETERLLLRPPLPADRDAHFAIHGDPETNRFNPSGPIADREESADILTGWISHWARQGFGYWAVSLRAAPGEVVGFGGIALRPVGGVERPNLYFRLSPRVWGRGIATELARAAIDSSTPGRDVFALVRPDNAPSIAVLRKLGFAEAEAVDDVPGAAPSLMFILRREVPAGPSSAAARAEPIS